MARDQLALLIKLESDKEEKLRFDFVGAQQHLANLQRQLTGIESFRSDYLAQLQSRAAQGVGGSYYNQFQQFIGKLDDALKQQLNAINTANKVLKQRESLWLGQKAKLEAIEKLKQRKLDKQQAALAKAEQKQLDEFATNIFVRNRKTLA
ncbi:flagellar biosynthesis chaperone [Pseudoalteromonas sp. P1-9]|uniref:flagellar export protein FliJ n=1 Tax=Pseudoalteromonas sp. P1-9 TaxID=1710354 RepID=UPI0006D61DEA|nr:flagellar export protein FliJ [Pseudoalteromonas sp. P1-9]KPV97576.1 flagellar biosynthesis chaperone [Pseudoalteromonas sp. P1-9]